MIEWDHSEAIYTPAEFAAATGLSTDLQRVWRRRKQLAHADSSGGQFTLHAAASVALQMELLHRGMSIGDAALASLDARSLVIFWSLTEATGACDVYGPTRFVEEFEAVFSDESETRLRLAGVPRGLQIQRYIVAIERDPPELKNDLDGILQGNVKSGFFVDLRILGRQFAERSGKPLLSVWCDDKKLSEAATKRRDISRRLLPSRPLDR